MSPLPCPRCEQPAPSDGSPCPACGHSLLLLGRYRIEGLLGRGGMSLVYRGRDTQTDGEVALKLLSRAGRGDPRMPEIFARSSRVLQSLNHPGVPRVYDFAADEPGRFVLVTELLAGGSLSERVESGHRFTSADLTRLAGSLLDVLEYLHGLVPPVIHRDIKPSNILFRTPGGADPVLADFDTVAPTLQRRSDVTLVYSWGYTAPEQVSGQASPRTDLYSLGATLLTVATHAHPDDLPRKGARFDVEPMLANLNANLRSLILRLVEPESHLRPASAAEARALLKPPRASRRAQVPAKVEPKSSWAPVWGILIVVGLVLAGIAVSGVASDSGEAEEPVATAKPAPLPPRRSEKSTVDPPLTTGCGTLAQCVAKCEKDDADGCNGAGFRHERGRGTEKNDAVALRYYDRACTLGSRVGCSNQALFLRNGRGGPADHARAIELYTRACDLEHGTACSGLGFMHQKGLGVPVDGETAARHYERACDLGHAAGCNDLGTLHEHGTGIPKDEAASARWYRLACDKGSMHGCSNLGLAYERGRGVEVDGTVARTFFERACAARHAPGCYHLGRAYESGLVGAADPASAWKRFDEACDGGELRACRQAGWLAQNGRGRALDYALAIRLYTRACEGGNATACNDLGAMAIKGLGGPKDTVRGKVYYEKACAAGNELGCKNLAKLNK